MSKHQPIEASTTASDSYRAQDLLNGHIARIDAGLAFLRSNKSRLVGATYEHHEARLLKFKRMCIAEMERIMAAPGSAFNTLGMFGSNAHGHRIDAACEAVDACVATAATVAAYRSGLRIVR
ncbi:hypothetical protein WG907_04560 [Sphingobium sp. AN558]|uniref:hypothetical protein n=1 Tax=Sphingobium sp. AN558 TaxID=3133442 RepID=UPI0030BEE87A